MARTSTRGNRMNVIKWNGKPINKPGWYSGIPIERYHSANLCVGPSVSSSDLRMCWAKSPAHMFANWAENADAIPYRPTRSMILGMAAHHLLLGEEGFKFRFVQQPLTYRDKVSGRDKPWHGAANYCKQWTETQ